jgi:hypothetical protein
MPLLKTKKGHARTWPQGADAMSYIEYTPKEPLAVQVVAAWKAQGIGIPDALASGHRLILPVWRHRERRDPLAIDLGLSESWVDYRAEVTDRDVVKALWSSHAFELIVESADGLLDVEHDDPTARYDPRALVSESTRDDLPLFARNVWVLYLFSQRLLDFAEGVEIGKPLPVPKFNADAMVEAVTGLTLGPKAVGR